jgi:TPR repeat
VQFDRRELRLTWWPSFHDRPNVQSAGFQTARSGPVSGNRSEFRSAFPLSAHRKRRYQLRLRLGSFAVNRKQRRMAGKLANAVPRTAPDATIGPSFLIAELLTMAQRLRQQGKFGEAAALYQQALVLQPSLAEAQSH